MTHRRGGHHGRRHALGNETARRDPLERASLQPVRPQQPIEKDVGPRIDRHEDDPGHMTNLPSTDLVCSDNQKGDEDRSESKPEHVRKSGNKEPRLARESRGRSEFNRLELIT